jgi:membrane fusion protein (multidrug efflux system)
VPNRRPEAEERDDARPGFLRRNRLTIIPAATAGAVMAAPGYLYWDHSRHFESTDDAYIQSRQFAVAPKVAGYLVAVPVTDNQHVAAGDVIARIDDSDYRVAPTAHGPLSGAH